MTSQEALTRIVHALQTYPELHGCVIGFEGDSQSRVLYPGIKGSRNYGHVAVILEERASSNLNVRIEDIPSEPTTAPEPPPYVTNGSRIRGELVGAGLSCSFAVVSAVGVVGGAAAEVPSLGTSTVLVVAAWTGFVTSTVSCANGIVRSVVVIRSPNENTLQRWDDNRYYSTAGLVVDAIGIGSSVVSLPYAARDVLAILERRGGLTVSQQLGSMSRLERETAIQRALRQATRTEEGQHEMEEALKVSGLTRRQTAQVMARGAQTIRRAALVTGVISKVTARRLHVQIANILAAAGGAGASASPYSVSGSATGSLNVLIVHVTHHETK